MTTQNNPIFNFKKAARTQCKASIMIQGLSGTGKSGLALALGEGLANHEWDNVFVIDTENKSAPLFVGIPSSSGGVFGSFNVGELTPDIGYKPSFFLTFREHAILAGAKVVIEDSISHAWQYKGGVLDMVTAAANRSTNKADKYASWRDPEVASEKQLILELIRDPRVHVISTVRVKEKFEYDTDSAGKKVLVSLGEQQIMQDDLKYEPDLVLETIEPGHVYSKTHIQYPKAKCTKTRYAMFNKGETYEFTPELIAQLKAYLEEGADPMELLEQQRQEYISGVTEFLDAKPNAKVIWTELKKQAGFEATKLSDMPLDVIKDLFIKLTI